MNRHLTAASLSIVSLLSACSASAERRLEGRVFDIPRANDITDNDKPFFLPALDPSDGFSFYLNPSASLPERNLVGVASKKRMCARAAGTEALVNSTVCASRSEEHTSELKSLMRNTYAVFCLKKKKHIQQ